MCFLTPILQRFQSLLQHTLSSFFLLILLFLFRCRRSRSRSRLLLFFFFFFVLLVIASYEALTNNKQNQPAAVEGVRFIEVHRTCLTPMQDNRDEPKMPALYIHCTYPILLHYTYTLNIVHSTCCAVAISKAILQAISTSLPQFSIVSLPIFYCGSTVALLNTVESNLTKLIR